MRRPRDAAMRRLSDSPEGLVPISTEYFAFIPPGGGRERALQPSVPRSCPAAPSRNTNSERRATPTPACRPTSGSDADDAPGNRETAARVSAGPAGRPPAPERSFQIDLGELAEEFADCTEHTDCSTGECRVKVLPTLYRIIRLIADSEDLANALPIILEVMEQRMRMRRGMISLLDRASGTIFIHASFGLTEGQKARGLYAPGEGIIGRVVASGKAIVSPSLRDNPLFLNRTGSHRDDDGADCTFVCVPILTGGKVLGTISGERSYASNRLLKQDFELLATIASMIAPAVELYLLENIERKNLENENRRLHAALKEKFKPTNIIGTSKPMQDVYELIGKVAPTRTTALLLGESGVGKELVANAIHYNSTLADGPFIKFNCAALPETIVESELFGHEKGSFTGATGLRKGRFELADGGTIFVDEVGELPLSVQAKLLRVLQEKTFERVGGSRPVKVDLRIIAATNRDLVRMVEDGQFREDLYYRLNVFPITIPPLRERGSDIIALADNFVARFARDAGKEVTRISTPALNMLMSYHWPGNVRELENVIERSVILCDDGVIHGYNMPPSLQMRTAEEVDPTADGGLQSRVIAVEYEMIVDALKLHMGNTTEAARELKITRRTLGLRMAKYGLNYKTFRGGT